MDVWSVTILPFMDDDRLTKVKKMLVKTNGIEWQRKLERLALIKERYKKLVLEPRKEIEFELAKDLEEENVSDLSVSSFSPV